MQGAIVAIIVAAAMLYAVWYWMPGSMRRALAARLAGRSARLAEAVGQAPGCGACKSCDSCATGDDNAAVTSSAVVQPPQSRRKAG